MRASKKVSQAKKSKTEISGELHISGAEGIYGESEILNKSAALIKRALSHSRGNPDQIVITIEKIQRDPRKAALLALTTADCHSPENAHFIIEKEMKELGISARAIKTAFNILQSDKTMRGAALVSIRSGKRMEPDHFRGVRVSRVGIEKSSERKLSRALTKSNINTSTVKEAIIIASKVATSSDIVAEICISDDPDYTTGYIACRKLGYLRIPNIKLHGQMSGGRVFFVKENASIGALIEYLEKEPLILQLRDE